MTGFGATDGGDAERLTTPTSVACRLFQPIGWAGRDTDATIRAVKGHNAAYGALCGRM